MTDAIAALRAQGRDRRRSGRHPTIVTTDPAQEPAQVGRCAADLTDAKGRDDDCSIVFKYGMKRDFNAWLASLGDRAPVKTLTELRAWNRAHQAAGTLKYGQAQLDISDEMDLDADRARYRGRPRQGRRARRRRGHRRGDEAHSSTRSLPRRRAARRSRPRPATRR